MYFLFLGLISWFLIVVLSGNYSVVVVCKRDFARSRSAKCWTAWTEETWQYIQTKVAHHVHIYTCHVYTQKPKKRGQHDMITQTKKQKKTNKSRLGTQCNYFSGTNREPLPIHPQSMSVSLFTTLNAPSAPHSLHVL